MFSGLIQTIGEVRETHPKGGGLHLAIRCAWPNEPITSGESVAVSGVCLTVEPCSFGFACDVSPETMSRTTLSTFRPGHRVNLERALRWQDRLGGHLVLGHVDAMARVLAIQNSSTFRTARLTLSSELSPEVAEKGSIAVDGISLTVARVGEGWFEVVLIPTTLGATTLDVLRKGDQVNLETDVLAKYVRRAVGGQRSSLAELLGGLGYAQD